MARPERVVMLVGGGVLGLVLAAVLVVLLAGTDEPRRYPPDSPEGVVQRYLDALHEGDTAAAEALLSARARAEWDRSPGAPRPFCRPDDRRVIVEDVEITGDRAVVTLSIEEYTGGGLGADSYRYEHTVPLVREEGAWKIDDPWFCV